MMTKACFDEIIHDPKVLQICAFLIPLRDAEFQVLRDKIDVSDPVLLKHQKRLGAAGYVKFVGMP
ncbi:MAG: hypothetical protein ACI9XK_004197 [Granulosicoccus sp.]|jgi:hypothetical protein